MLINAKEYKIRPSQVTITRNRDGTKYKGLGAVVILI